MARNTRNAKSPPGQRLLRVGEEIRHALAALFERDTLRDPALAGKRITVTEVRPSPDLRHAKVYIVPLGGGDTAGVLEGLKRVKPYLRRQLADRLQIRFIPDLIFAADQSFDEAEHIARLLHKPEVARDLDAERYGEPTDESPGESDDRPESEQG
ncbi:MAG: 30S ribosome-binding factor RbfA [Rhodospirillaceae bacterium]